MLVFKKSEGEAFKTQPLSYPKRYQPEVHIFANYPGFDPEFLKMSALLANLSPQITRFFIAYQNTTFCQCLEMKCEEASALSSPQSFAQNVAGGPY